MSLSTVIFPTGTYTVTRTAIGTRTNGRYTSGAVSTFEMVAGIQPVEGRVLKDLPAGMRAEETRVVFTTVDLRGLDPAAPGVEPDVIAIDGEPWRVEKAQRYGIIASRTRAWITRTSVP